MSAQSFKSLGNIRSCLVGLDVLVIESILWTSDGKISLNSWADVIFWSRVETHLEVYIPSVNQKRLGSHFKNFNNDYLQVFWH